MPEPAPTAVAPNPEPRFDAIDLLRGLVIALMTIDHASGAFNAGRFFSDGSFFWKPGTPIPEAQFFLRFITHLCAPTFVFLAGTSIALSSARRSARGESLASIDRALLVRGAFIALLDPLWMSLGFFGYSALLFQVMYTLGASMMLMVPLRRLSLRTLALGALVFCLASEALVGLGVIASGGSPSLPVALLLSGGRFPLPFARPSELIVAYPVLPWLALMMLGHAFGTWLLSGPRDIVRKLLGWGAASLALFVIVRGANGYGNMRLLREAPGLAQWLHVSKYPPSLSYVTLELGLAALLLALFFHITRQRTAPALAPLRLLGQTALFFYLLHAHLLEGASLLLGMHSRAGIAVTLLAALVALVVLLPACARYARYKRAHPNGLARYV